MFGQPTLEKYLSSQVEIPIIADILKEKAESRRMIHFQNKTRDSLRVDYPLLRKIQSSIIEDHGMDPAKTQLSLVLTTDRELKSLNSVFRNIADSTDVLSFPADEIDPQSGNRYLGDIVISMDQVKKQSLELGDEEKSILILLTIHGLLHLLGYDHITRSGKEKMWSEQTRYLTAFKIKVRIPD